MDLVQLHAAFTSQIMLQKRQNRTSNVSALLVKMFTFHHQNSNKMDNIQSLNKLLLQQGANMLNRDQQFSVLEVISYLMGWDNHYESHHYSNIYWDRAQIALNSAYPDLIKKVQDNEEV